ncbi:MAG: type II secretion system GspH family protein, partial [Muribaculaceae bacterium]|nr:type II secretion system GspH family protein [Muribaculaceae bacterium]
SKGEGRVRVRHAFTLAEVLITLGIIGVVAAMTIPGLITAYQSKAHEVALRKTYSKVQSALSLIVEDYGYAGCYVHYVAPAYVAEKSDCDNVKQSLVSMLKLQKFDTEVNKKYAEAGYVKSKGGSATNWGCTYDAFVTSASTQAYVSLDGTLYFLWRDGNRDMPWIIVDVNNEKGPNKWGYDVFWMTLSNKNEKLLLTDEYCSLIEKGGKFPRTIIKSQKDNSSEFKPNW